MRWIPAVRKILNIERVGEKVRRKEEREGEGGERGIEGLHVCQ
jgi:hypothetical protein